MVCLTWGFIGPVVKVCSSDIDPTVLAVLRYLFAVVICALLLLLLEVTRRETSVLSYITHYSLLRVGRYALPNIAVSLIASVIGFGISIPVFFEAVKIAGVYLTYVIGMSVSVIVVSVTRSLLGQELVTKYKIAYCTLLTALCIYTVAISRPSLDQLAYILLFAVSWGLYTVLISFISRPFRNISDVVATTMIDILIATIIGTVTATTIFRMSSKTIAQGIMMLLSNIRDLLLVVVFLSLTATVLAYMITYIIVSIKPETVVLLSIFQFIEVIQGILIGIFYFHELTLSELTLSYLIVSVIALAFCSWTRQLEVKRSLKVQR